MYVRFITKLNFCARKHHCCSSTNLFPQWKVGLILVSLALDTVGQVIGHAVVERVWVHEDFVQLIQKPSLQTLFLFVFFDLESRWILHRGIEKNNYWGSERKTEGIFKVHQIQKKGDIVWKVHHFARSTFFLMGTATLDLIWLKVFIKNLDSSGDWASFSALSIPKWCFLQS